MSDRPRARRRLRRVLRRLEWTVIRRLDGVLHGDYRTLFRGYGLDLADLREYQLRRRRPPHRLERHRAPADALRARVQRGARGHRVVPARPEPVGGLRLAASCRSARSRPSSSPCWRAPHPPRQPRRRAVLRRAASTPSSRRAAAGARCCTSCTGCCRGPSRAQSARHRPRATCCAAAYRVMPRRSLVFVVSDFISAPGWAEPLAHLAQRHEVVAVRLYDPLEMELPDLGLLVVQDAETGEQLFVDTHDRGFRERFAAAAARREDELRAAFARRRRGRARAVDRRRPGRRDPALRRPAQAAQPARDRRRPAARTWRGGPP